MDAWRGHRDMAAEWRVSVVCPTSLTWDELRPNICSHCGNYCDYVYVDHHNLRRCPHCHRILDVEGATRGHRAKNTGIPRTYARDSLLSELKLCLSHLGAACAPEDHRRSMGGYMDT